MPFCSLYLLSLYQRWSDKKDQYEYQKPDVKQQHSNMVGFCFILFFIFFWLADMTNVLVLYFLLSQNAFWLQIFYSQCIYLRYKHLPTHSMLSQFYLYQNSKLKQNYFDYLKYIRYFYNHDTKRNPSSDTERGVHHCLMFNFTLFLSYDGHVLLSVNRSRLT